MKKTAILLLNVLASTFLYGQSDMNIVINANNTPFPPYAGVYHTYADLTPELAASDVQLLNISMNTFGAYMTNAIGAIPVFYGKFIYDGISDIGIDSGLVISSGQVPDFSNPPSHPIPWGYSGIPWPAMYNSGAYYPGGYSTQTYNFSFRSDQYSDLVDLNNGDSIADANILEFDFVPQGNFIRLQYVFASEEYPENTCNTPNDVMGIFLSGPGITGYQNIALIPGTNIPVGMNTITPPGMACGELPDYSQFYVDNTGGQNVIFDGFTTLLTASAAVTPCDTYHLRIAVADGARHDEDSMTLALDSGAPVLSHYDSGIFLKFGSLRSTDSLWLEARGGVANDSLSPYAVRGCMPGSFRIYRDAPTSLSLDLSYTLSGSAVPGQDYTPLSGTVTIPANVSYVDIPVNVLSSGSGAKTLQLKLENPYSSPCMIMTSAYLDSATLDIKDGLFAEIPQTDTIICPGCSMQIMVNGDPGLQYAWSPATGLDNAATQSPLAAPPQTTLYRMTAGQPAPSNCPQVEDSVLIYVQNVGVDEINKELQIRIVPNPFNHGFRITTGQDDRRIYIMTMTNLLGQQVLSLQGTVNGLNQQLENAGASLHPGNYFLYITAEQTKQSYTFKLVKIR